MTDDMMLEKLVVHLLRQTPGRVVQYPKVTMHKIQSVLPFMYATSDWLERRKLNIIVIQELNHLQPRLKLSMKLVTCKRASDMISIISITSPMPRSTSCWML